MLIYEGKQYLTRCGLTVSITEKAEDPRDHYPFTGQFENGEQQGFKDFWTKEGVFIEGGEQMMDLVSEL